MIVSSFFHIHKSSLSLCDKILWISCMNTSTWSFSHSNHSHLHFIHHSYLLSFHLPTSPTFHFVIQVSYNLGNLNWSGSSPFHTHHQNSWFDLGLSFNHVHYPYLQPSISFHEPWFFTPSLHFHSWPSFLLWFICVLPFNSRCIPTLWSPASKKVPLEPLKRTDSTRKLL